MRTMYDNELLVLCKGSKDRVKAQRVGWDAFKEYAKAKEVGELSHQDCEEFSPNLHAAELWHIFRELDLDSNGQLDANELRSALRKSGAYMLVSIESCPA